jgi:hypothetical protein
MPKHSTTLRRGGGGLGLGNGATVAAGAAGSTRTLDRHPSRPAPLPHPSRPTPLPHPSHISFHPPRNYPPLSCRVARRRPCSLGGPTRLPSSLGAGRPVAVHAGRAYKNTCLQTGLQPEQPTEAARSSSPVFSCSRFSARFLVQYC